jgi:hypothetical protein
MSSSDSFSSGDDLSSVRSCGPNNGWIFNVSLPLKEAGGVAVAVLWRVTILLDDGYYYCYNYYYYYYILSMIGSDRWVGSAVDTLFDLASGGASVISVVSDVACSCVYYYNVH